MVQLLEGSARQAAPMGAWFLSANRSILSESRQPLRLKPQPRLEPHAPVAPATAAASPPPTAASLADDLISFRWRESGRILEGFLYFDSSIKPSEVMAVIVNNLPDHFKGWRYKVKLIQGQALQNLRPESWAVLGLVGDSEVFLEHHETIVMSPSAEGSELL